MSDIKYAYPLILNKVASPQYATATLRRPRLIEWLNNAAHCRATVVAADAGYGKTTLLWQWEREVDFPCYWYKLDRSDRDWTFHISYLIEAIAKRHPGFGMRAHSMLRQLGGPGSSRPGVAAYLLAEMHERLTEPCTFIIDDWHYVNAVTEVRGLWNQILRDAPPTCRFVFSSRAKPKLQFARFKTHNGYAELRTDSLRFTQEEITELFRETYNSPLQTAEVSELDQRTEGWAASLQMIEVSLRRRTTPNDRRAFLESINPGNDTDLFEFLAEEVLEQQPAETRDLLLSTSILQQITPEIAERLAGVHDGRRELAQLEHRGLFTHRLDADRFRYHNLFREFLQRRLLDDRSRSEVVGLHIHAASYFETTQLWPEAIHHYLEAGLQRQAARLIAKYGEEVATEGRIGLIDGWLPNLPMETLRQNARLSLLYGELSGIRGDLPGAIVALERAREFFLRKGDRRLEALAYLKISTVRSNFGDAEGALEAAQLGAELVPDDEVGTRLRLEGNLAITRTWLSEPLSAAAEACLKIARDATDRGYEHFAAIAKHNAGGLMLRMGRLGEAVENLREAGRYWSAPPTSPFADNAELVSALLASGDVPAAREAANAGVQATRPWPRPHADAQYGLALARAADGRFAESLGIHSDILANPDVLGSIHAHAYAAAIETSFLVAADRGEIRRLAQGLAQINEDPRYLMDTAPARAIAAHVATNCKGGCLKIGRELVDAAARGATYSALIGAVKIGALALSHGGSRHVAAAWDAVRAADAAGFLPPLRWWLRLYAAHSDHLSDSPEGAELLEKLVVADPDGWRRTLLRAIERASGATRKKLLLLMTKNANRETVDALRTVRGPDVAEARRRLQHFQAARLYLRTFGGIALHRGNWNGPPVVIPKRRLRSFLGVLAAHSHKKLTRDLAVELLWPSSDADSAVNNLNQTVFQLRRCIDPHYRAGESAEYVISTADQVSLNPDLVHTDLVELSRLGGGGLTAADRTERQAAARKAVELVRGEFLADLRYEDWAAQEQVHVHNQVRTSLMPVAQNSSGKYDLDVAVMASSTLVALDPYDEAATLAFARNLEASGRPAAARDLVVAYVQRLRDEFEEEPAPELTAFVPRAGQV